MKKIKILFLSVAVLAVTGCTNNGSSLLGAMTPSQFNAIDYYHWLSMASPDATDNERLRLEQQILLPGAEEALVQLAVLISTRSDGPDDAARARALLVEFDRRAVVGPVDSEYQIFSKLWRETLEMREAVQLLSDSKTEDDERIQALESESAELRRQIEALKRIEQQLDRRAQVRDDDQADANLLR